MKLFIGLGPNPFPQKKFGGIEMWRKRNQIFFFLIPPPFISKVILRYRSLEETKSFFEINIGTRNEKEERKQLLAYARIANKRTAFKKK